MNSTNETFYPLDYWFSSYGYPYILDLIATYLITPIWLLSLIFSIFSLFILLKRPFFASNFFSYMRLYVGNCLILSILSLTTILATTRRFLSISNTYEATFYCIYVFIFTENILFLFSSCIEICLVVERILFILPTSFRRIKLISFNKFFLILFVICIAINIPSIFLFDPAFIDVQLDQNRTFRVWYIGFTNFSFSLTGQILNYFGYIFHDILPMICKIILNSLSVYLVGKYVKNKQLLRATGTTTKANADLVSFDRKQTYIGLIMNTFSLLEHIFYILNYVLYFLYYYDLANLVYIIAIFFIAMKHFLIFFILLLLNNLFRNEVKNFFK